MMTGVPHTLGALPLPRPGLLRLDCSECTPGLKHELHDFDNLHFAQNMNLANFSCECPLDPSRKFLKF